MCKLVDAGECGSVYDERMRTYVRVHSCACVCISPVYEGGFLTENLTPYHRQHKHILRIITGDQDVREKSSRYQGNQLARQRLGAWRMKKKPITTGR